MLFSSSEFVERDISVDSLIRFIMYVIRSYFLMLFSLKIKQKKHQVG